MVFELVHIASAAPVEDSPVLLKLYYLGDDVLVCGDAVLGVNKVK
jgi:hypothetical protein